MIGCRVENNRYSLIKNTPGGYILTEIGYEKFFPSLKSQTGRASFLCQIYNSVKFLFFRIIAQWGVPKTPEGVENATFSIWWFIHPLATKTHLIFLNFLPFISILIFPLYPHLNLHLPYIFSFPPPIFLSLKNFYHPQFHTIRKKNFFTCQSKSQESSIIFHP